MITSRQFLCVPARVKAPDAATHIQRVLQSLLFVDYSCMLVAHAKLCLARSMYAHICLGSLLCHVHNCFRLAAAKLVIYLNRSVELPANVQQLIYLAVNASTLFAAPTVLVTTVVVCCRYLGGQFSSLKGMRACVLACTIRIFSDVHEVAMRCVSISPRSVEPGCHNVVQSAAETCLLLHPCTHLFITSGYMMQVVEPADYGSTAMYLSTFEKELRYCTILKMLGPAQQ